MIDKIKAFIEKVKSLWARLPAGKYIAGAVALLVLSLIGKTFGVLAAVVLCYLALKRT